MYYNLVNRKEMAYTLQPLFCKAGYRPVSVQCLNSAQNSAIMMMIREAVMSGVVSVIDRHPDGTEIYFILQIQDNGKLIPCFRTF